MDARDASVTPSPTTGAHDPIGEFRAELETRREAEDVIADALATRQQAAAYAEDLIRHSEALAREIEERARETARVATDEANARAEQVVADAEAKAARITAAAELDATRARHEEAQLLAEVGERTKRAMRRLEAMAGEAQTTLERAQADLAALAELGARDAADPSSAVEEARSGGDKHDRRRNPFRSLY